MAASPDPAKIAKSSTQQLRRILVEPDFFRMVFDALPLQIVVKGARPANFGHFLHWNCVAEDWMGLHSDQNRPLTDYDIFPPDQAAFFVMKDREVANSRKPLDIPEEPFQHRTLGLRYLHTIKTPILDDDGVPLALLNVSEDITERKRAVHELDLTLRRLRDERNLFRALLDHLPVSVFAKSARPENFGVYVQWNRVMEELHGMSADQVLGRRTSDIFDAEVARSFDDQDQLVIERGRALDIPLQPVTYHRSGERLMHTVKAPVFDAEGKPLAIVGVAEDITDRVRSDTERVRAMEMLRQLNSRVPGAIYQLSVAPDGARKFIYLSERIEEIYGIPASRMLEDARLAGEAIFPADRASVLESERRATREGVFFKCEFRVFHSRLGLRWAHSSASGQPSEDGGIIWSGFIMDVTDRKRAEEALRESEERWELALAGTEAGVWDWDLPAQRLFFSERWQRMFGYRGSDLPATARDLLALVHEDDQAEVRRCTRDLLRRHTDLFRCEYRMRCRDGEWVWILAHAKAHFGARGRPTRMIGTLIDIGDRKRVEAQLVEAKVTAENANRAKSDFLAMMSHEIRTPLNGVLGFAELLDGTPLDPTQEEYLQVIRESGSNLLHVLNDILDYSKIESGKLALDAQPVDLGELVETAVETFRAKAHARGLELLCEVAAAAPRVVVVDAMRLRQVLANLISNAVKFTAKGSVRLGVEALGPPAPDGRVPLRFRVTDSGIGIAEEDLPRLFEPFEQLDLSMARRFGGTGLGLSIVHRLVGLMGGKISATSAPGAGTTFDVELALTCPGENVARTALPRPFADAIPTPMSLLLVDDHAVNRRLARLMLQRLGYTPDEAADGAQAVDLVGRRNYDVILLDIQMPGMDGYEAARLIREISPRSQLVALTAHAMPTDRQRSYEQGMHAHLTKPVRVDELREVLAGCAARASQMNGIG